VDPPKYNNIPNPKGDIYTLNIKYIFSLVERFKFVLLPYLPVPSALWLVKYKGRFLLHSLLKLCGSACFGAQVSSKYGTWYSERVILQFMCVGSWAGITYLRYTVLTSPTEDETAVHCCDPALSVLVMLVSRNVFHVASTLQSTVCHYIFWPRSLVDSTLAAFFVCGPLQFLVSLLKSIPLELSWLRIQIAWIVYTK